MPQGRRTAGVDGMRLAGRPLVCVLLYLFCGGLAVWAIQTNVPAYEVVGIIILVLLAGLMIVSFFRRRRQITP